MACADADAGALRFSPLEAAGVAGDGEDGAAADVDGRGVLGAGVLVFFLLEAGAGLAGVAAAAVAAFEAEDAAGEDAGRCLGVLCGVDVVTAATSSSFAVLRFLPVVGFGAGVDGAVGFAGVLSAAFFLLLRGVALITAMGDVECDEERMIRMGSQCARQ